MSWPIYITEDKCDWDLYSFNNYPIHFPRTLGYRCTMYPWPCPPDLNNSQQIVNVYTGWWRWRDK